MNNLIKRLRDGCIGTPAKIPWPHRLLHDAADTLEHTTWHTNMDNPPENTPLLVELTNDNSGTIRYSVLLYWDFGGDGEFAWMTTDDMSQIDHWNWTPTKWMCIPPD